MVTLKEFFDFVVIGAGPAGSEAGGILARSAGKGAGKVALVEREHPGGTCLNWGCIPTKALASAARKLFEARGAGNCGIMLGEMRLDARRLIARVQETVAGLRNDMLFSLKKLPLEYIPGEARVDADGVIAVRGEGNTVRLLAADKVLLATGSRAGSLPGIPLDGETVMDSRGLLAKLFAGGAIPPRLAVIGGGAIGCELSWILATFGSQVTVLEIAPQLLPGMDKDVAGQLAAAFGKQGITVKTGTTVQGVQVVAGEARVKLAGGEEKGGEMELAADLVLLSVGRVADLSYLDPAALGIRLDRGRVAVDVCLQTTRPGWYAAGDLTPGPMLAYTASDQGAIAARNMLGEKHEVTSKAIPLGVFCHPECAQVGEISGPGLVSARAFFRANSRARCEDAAEGLVKVFAEKESGVIRGFSLIGPHVTELVGECTVLVEEKVTLERYSRMLHLHPVLGESLAAAAEKLMSG